METIQELEKYLEDDYVLEKLNADEWSKAHLVVWG